MSFFGIGIISDIFATVLSAHFQLFSWTRAVVSVVTLHCLHKLLMFAVLTYWQCFDVYATILSSYLPLLIFPANNAALSSGTMGICCSMLLVLFPTFMQQFYPPIFRYFRAPCCWSFRYWSRPPLSAWPDKTQNMASSGRPLHHCITPNFP